MRNNLTAIVIALSSLPTWSLAENYDSFENAPTQEQSDEDFRMLLLLAEQGDPDAQNKLGSMYYMGDDVKRDRTEAERWFRSAAEQGNSGAQYALGEMYYEGEVVPRDKVKAHMWFNISSLRPYYQGNNAAYMAAQIRDMIANEMTADEVSEARQNALVCVLTEYQECD